MLEVLCTIIIFLNVIVYITSMHIKNLKLKSYNNKVENYISSVNILKNTILYNYNKENLDSIVKKEVYIKEAYIDPNTMKNLDLKDMISNNKPNNKPYISLTKNKEKIIIYLYSKEKDINCQFYKGD